MPLAAVVPVAFVVAVVLTPVAMRVALRTGVVDRPGPLKPQAAPVPYLGGIAVFAGTLVGAASGHPVVIAPLAGALVLGVVDDRVGVAPWLRLLGQVAVGAGVAAVVPTRLGGVGGALAVGAATVVLMNGVNFLDGLDALASGVCALACAAFAVVLHHAGRDLGAAGAAALAGFLVFNRPPARIYLGDGGAYLVGATLALLLATAWSGSLRMSVSVGSVVLVAIPAAEVAFAVVRRLRGRHSVTRGDRRHPYDLAVARGWSRPRAAAAYVGAQVVLAVVAVALSATHAVGAAVAALVVVAGALVAVGGMGGALSPGPEPAP
jgi:UDP-GlcNAc:undecaprenyl-phosphate GlcNAc-1-phosphate transferase